MKSSTIALGTTILFATFSGVAFAQVGAPVPEVPKAEAAETNEAASRVVTVSADQKWVNVGEFERVKFVTDGKETVVPFYNAGVEQVDVGGKQVTVYVAAGTMFSSPGD
jgi:hypothetical protein